MIFLLKSWTQNKKNEPLYVLELIKVAQLSQFHLFGSEIIKSIKKKNFFFSISQNGVGYHSLEPLQKSTVLGLSPSLNFWRWCTSPPFIGHIRHLSWATLFASYYGMGRSLAFTVLEVLNPDKARIWTDYFDCISRTPLIVIWAQSLQLGPNHPFSEGQSRQQ